jgi:TRAP-type C4-dicarboxylate transport system substrate-binding protein
MIVFPNSQIHLRAEPPKWDNLQGQKISTTTRPVAQVLNAIGAAPVSIIISEAYEAIQRGTVDGVVTPYTAMQPFKLHEVTNFHLEVPMGGAGAHVLMTQKKLDSLPAKAREILWENSGEKQSRLFGAFWDRILNSGRKMVENHGDQHNFAQLTPDQLAAWEAKANAVAKEFAASIPGGTESLDAFKAELKKVEAGK